MKKNQKPGDVNWFILIVSILIGAIATYMTGLMESHLILSWLFMLLLSSTLYYIVTIIYTIF